MSESNNTFSLPLLVTRGAVVFPGTSIDIPVGRLESKSALIASENLFSKEIILVTQYDVMEDDIDVTNICNIGVKASITSIDDTKDIFKVKFLSTDRVKLNNIRKNNDENGTYVVADVEEYNLGKFKSTPANLKLFEKLYQAVTSDQNPAGLPKAILYKLERINDYEKFTDIVSYHLNISLNDRIKLLAAETLVDRIELLNNLVTQEYENNEIERTLIKSVQEKSEKAQKEYILREKMRAIQDELRKMGALEEDTDTNEYLKKLDENPYPESLKKRIRNEITRFNQLPPASVEYSMAKGYIDTVMQLPWFEEDEEINDINFAQKVLDEDHYGLEKVKERIIEYLAVKQVTNSLKAPILCLYGPPGTGKTSLAKSIARALNRKFVKAALGGTSDESEIRGHRRTYVASMPGKIIKGMKEAGVINPVFLLDEIDKLTANNHGDPGSALLEVLDPEQNQFFQDNYIEEKYDLSKVLFIATANYLENIPPALRDRLELIELNTYTNEEKYHICVEHLIPKQCANNGINPKKIEFEEKAIYYIIDRYTREAGVRDLERKIGTIVRKAIVHNLKNGTNRKQVITVKVVKEYLGVEFFDVTSKEKEAQIGVVSGLAYTQYGGDILPIEVTRFAGKGGLVLTGNLGQVMKESASIALSYVRANAEKFLIDPSIFEKADIHIHFPEGAIPKDGPSAGLAITLGIVSCLSNRKVRADIAMTGEISLRGKALAIGGLKEKTLAAYRGGIKKVLIPRENERNLVDIANVVKENVEFVLLDNFDQVIDHAMV